MAERKRKRDDLSKERLFAAVGRFLPRALALTFALVLTGQSWLLVQPQRRGEEVAALLQGELISDQQEQWQLAAQREELFAYITLELAPGQTGDCRILINGGEAGSLAQGVLTFRASAGDHLTLVNRSRETLTVRSAAFPPNLDAAALPLPATLAPGSSLAWGKVIFK